jgi:maltose alpha-D-glucosyltransferase/alpha-amylase
MPGHGPPEQRSRRASPRAPRRLHERPPAAPGWYRDAIIYELHPRAFRDSDGDGIGDFRGLTEKLDYLVDLGVTAIWLLPFFPSPGRDDGYDTADYTAVHPQYGTLQDVRVFLAEAHRRGLRVIGELVLNHTSDQHAWFQRARRSPPGSPWRRYYVWSDTPDRYRDARIIFTDTETSNWTWDPVAGAYYWHRFFSHQPDLNFENPRVRQEMMAVIDFWLDLGLDGLRLDAVPYLYEADGTSCENLPATHEFLRELRRHVDDRYGDRMLLAEANQWPEDAVAYFGTDAEAECHMAFHFPLMPRLFMAVRTEDRFPIIDILDQTPPIPVSAQWAIFLRNHDELTLEMVTDEERDYLYRAYASDPAARINLGIRRRLAPLTRTRRLLELLYGLLMSLPGTPVIYYGDEIGMGDNYHLGDRDAVRTPMQWSPDRNAGFSEANRQRLYLPLIVDPEYHFEAVNVAVQEANPSSLLWWMKRVIALRRRHSAFARGTFEIVETANRHVLAYLRRDDNETLLAVFNLSRYAQWCQLDLAGRAGERVTELFGRTEFPPVSGSPYPLTLGPRSFLWFLLESPHEEDGGPPTVAADEPHLAGVLGAARHRGSPLAAALESWHRRNPGHASGDAIPSSSRIIHVLPLDLPERDVALVLLREDTRAGDVLVMPLALELIADTAEREAPSPPRRTIARVRVAGSPDNEMHLVDVSREPDTGQALGALEHGIRRSMVRSIAGRHQPTEVHLVGRAGRGSIPEVRTAARLLAAGAPIEPILGELQVEAGGERYVVGLLVPIRDPHVATFADEAAGSFDRLLEAAAAQPDVPARRSLVAGTILDSGDAVGDELVRHEVAETIEAARQVGASLASTHDALGGAEHPPVRPYASADRRVLFQRVRTLYGEVIAGFRGVGPPAGADDVAAREAVTRARPVLEARLKTIIGCPLDGLRTSRYGSPIGIERFVRGEGGYLVRAPVVDSRTEGDRERIRTPLLDVAAVLVSLRAVALAPLARGSGEEAGLGAGDALRTEAWGRTWWSIVGRAFVAGYAANLARSALIPSTTVHRELLLDLLMSELTLDAMLAELRTDRLPARPLLVGLLDLAG